jgi:hypothetical protein
MLKALSMLRHQLCSMIHVSRFKDECGFKIRDGERLCWPKPLWLTSCVTIQSLLMAIV